MRLRPHHSFAAALSGGAIFLAAGFSTPSTDAAVVDVPALLSRSQDEDAEALVRQKELLDLARSKDPVERERAAVGLGADASQKADAALLKLGDDDDAIVRLAAVQAMGGRGSSSVTKLLAKMALGAPLSRVRRASAEALAKTSVEDTREAFLKKASGKTGRRAAEALLWAEASLVGEERSTASDTKQLGKAVKSLRKMLKSKDPDDRVAGIGATVALTRGSGGLREAQLQEHLIQGLGDYKKAEVACAVLDAAAMTPDPADAPALIELLAEEDLMTVVERRLELALLGTLRVMPDTERTAALTEMLSGVKGDGEFRGARLARMAAVEGARGLANDERTEILRTLMQSGSLDARAAASKSLVTVGDAGVKLALKEVADDAVDARVGVQCIRVLQLNGDLAPLDDGAAEAGSQADKEIAEPSGAVRSLILLAEDHKDSLVQEQAAIALGRPGIHPAAVDSLAGLAKRGGGIALRNVATVALGRTRAEEAVAALAEILTDSDWMMRATAAEGLLQVSSMACVEPLLNALEDENAQVVATVEQALKRFSSREGEEVERSTWRAWWAENGKRARFRTREEAKERQERYGYEATDASIYVGMDVIVVPGLGDHIEKVLEQLGIEFRTVLPGKLDEAGLHPGAILLIGCTGEISASDVETVQWYVRTGGALFTSCWALSHTVVPTHPAVIRKFPSPGEVVDNVFAKPTVSALGSPYLRGVFEGEVQPYYSLQGAHLIEVVDPERAEVILDSPYAAARHGSGDLAAYFRMGHGVILDTANHFEEQGFASAPGLKGAEECQAFAVNHMGLSLLDLRQVQDEKWWKSPSKAAAEIADLSVFRILTNFVREKRING